MVPFSLLSIKNCKATNVIHNDYNKNTLFIYCYLKKKDLAIFQ